MSSVPSHSLCSSVLAAGVSSEGSSTWSLKSSSVLLLTWSLGLWVLSSLASSGPSVLLLSAAATDAARAVLVRLRAEVSGTGEAVGEAAGEAAGGEGEAPAVTAFLLRPVVGVSMLTPGPGVKLLRMREMLILNDAALIFPSALKSFVALVQLIWKCDHGQ
jgi:hypothetical protein